jgi:hypothetical protein
VQYVGQRDIKTVKHLMLHCIIPSTFIVFIFVCRKPGTTKGGYIEGEILLPAGWTHQQLEGKGGIQKNMKIILERKATRRLH